MNARNKLNGMHLKAATVIAGTFGLITGSWPVFVVVLLLLLFFALSGGDIRPGPTNRRRRD